MTPLKTPKHPLHLLLNFPDHHYSAHDPERCTGRSTIAILRIIAYALENPGKRIRITDHHGTIQAARHTAMRLKDMVGRLELLGFNYFESEDRDGVCVIFGANLDE
jgi:hypothetical protein